MLKLASFQAVASEDDPAASFSDNVILSWTGDQTFTLTPDQVKGLNKEDLVKIWKVGQLKKSPRSQQ